MYWNLTRSLLVLDLLFSCCGLFAQSPGGVGHQSVWLQGNFSASTSPPQRLNFNPAMPLDRNSTHLDGHFIVGDLRRATIFTVYQKSVSAHEGPIWQMTGGFGDLLLSPRQVSGSNGKMNLVFENSKASAENPNKPATVISTYLRRNGARPTSENADQKKLAIALGDTAFSTAGHQPGLLGEMIVYETILKPAEITRVETYLALKYGVTLEKNYLNSKGETIWNRKTETLFSNNIAGIGRDDHAALYQKQSTSCSALDQLVMGANQIVQSNEENTASINDGDFLIWGDNAMPFTLNGKAGPEQTDLLLSPKKWLMKRSGKTAATISTSLQIDTKTVLPASYPKENFCLVIDRKGVGDFAPENCTYLIPDAISSDGIAHFGGVLWDTDGSGKDVFSFGVRPRLSADGLAKDLNGKEAAKLISFHIYPNPIKEGRYTITATLDKRADVLIRIYDLHLQLIDSRKLTGQAEYMLTGTINAAAGPYIVKLLTPGAKEFSQLIIKQ